MSGHRPRQPEFRLAHLYPQCPCGTVAVTYGEGAGTLRLGGRHGRVFAGTLTALVAALASSVSLVPVATASAPSGAWSSPAISGGAPLDGISCVSTTFCAAIDEAGNAYVWDGSAWSAATPVVTVSPNQYPGALAVSCASPSFCMVTGIKSQFATWNGLTWSPSSINDYDTINAVSCPMAGFCMAVDTVGNALTWNGSTWSSATLIGAQPPSGESVTLDAVACGSTQSCVAGDDAGRVYSWNGSAWSAPFQLTGLEKGIDGLSCGSPTSCVAVSNGGHAFSWDGSRWSAPTLLAKLTVMSSVSCASAGAVGSGVQCAAVDAKGNVFRGTLVPGSKPTWSGPNVLTAGTPLGGVSCVQGGQCAAVDLIGGVHGVDLSSLPAGSPVSPPAVSKLAYGPPQTYALDGLTSGIASANLGNGHKDLAVSITGYAGGSSQLAVLTGRGDGTYTPPAYYRLPGSALSVVAADFRGIGRDDIAVEIIDGNSIEIAVMNSFGAGRLSPPVIYPTDLAVNGVQATEGLSTTTSRAPGETGPSLLINNVGYYMDVLVNQRDHFSTIEDVFTPQPSPITERNTSAAPTAVLGDLSGTGPLQLAAPAFASGISVGALQPNTGQAGSLVTLPRYRAEPQGDLAFSSGVAAIKVMVSDRAERLVEVSGESRVTVTRYWVGPQGAIAPVQRIPSTGFFAQASTVGYFGPQRTSGVAVLGQECSLTVFPSDGNDLLAPRAVAPNANQCSAVAAVDRPGRSSDLAVTTDQFFGKSLSGTVEVYPALVSVP